MIGLGAVPLRTSHCAAAVFAAAAALGLADPANAQPLEGEWTNSPSFCGRGYSINNDNAHISAQGYRVLESYCEFTGGTKYSPQHWMMKGSCSGEGPSASGLEIAIELRSQGGQLHINEGGRALAYTYKCGEPSHQRGHTYWNHKGSRVYLVVEGSRRRFYYAVPRPGMQEAGARVDDLLFEGTSDGKSYDGTAFIFNPRCAPAAYRVSGPIHDGGRRVEMRGSAPRIGDDCRVTGYSPDVLIFTLSPEH
jgi:hypothetical protein